MRDPEYTGHDDSTGGNYGPSAPSRQGYLELNVDDCADLEIDPYDFATFEMNQNKPIESCKQGSATSDIYVANFLLKQIPLQTIIQMRKTMNILVNCILMYMFLVDTKITIQILGRKSTWYAVHESALPKTDSSQMIHVEIPFRVDFHNGYCHGGAWFEGNYVANENAPFEDESNRFIFQLQTWLELGDYNSSTQASQPTSVGDCTIRPKLNMQYKYFGT